MTMTEPATLLTQTPTDDHESDAGAHSSSTPRLTSTDSSEPRPVARINQAIAGSSSARPADLKTSAVNTYPSGKAVAKGSKKKKAILDPNFRYRISTRQVAINVNGESERVNGVKIEMYIPLVKWLAGRISSCLPPHVDREELISEGFCGLMEAAYKYRPEKGRFETFARNRICGSMQDWLRSIDTLPRSARETLRKIETAEHDLTVKLNRPPTLQEIASQLNISVKNLSKRKSRLDMSHAGATVAIRETSHISDSSLLSGDMSMMHSVSKGPAPMAREYMNAVIADVVTSLLALDDRDKLICLLSVVEGAEVHETVSLLATNPARVKLAKDSLKQNAKLKVF
jgi:RNA polymerase sigma factor for flagellar operon FliA